MEIRLTPDRPAPRVSMEGALQEVSLLQTEDRWELALVQAQAGASVPPLPFPTDELGFILAGRVELTLLPQDYDVGTPLADQATIAVLGPGDAFSVAHGDRVMIEVQSDMTFLLCRRIPTESGTSPPPGLCA